MNAIVMVLPALGLYRRVYRLDIDPLFDFLHYVVGSKLFALTGQQIELVGQIQNPVARADFRMIPCSAGRRNWLPSMARGLAATADFGSL